MNNNIPLRDPSIYKCMHHEDDDQHYKKNSEEQMRSSSKSSSRRHSHNNITNKVSPLISRSVRAKRRQAFLRTYQLSHLNNNSIETAATSESKCNDKMKWKEAAAKLKSAIISLASAARLSLVNRGCSCGYLPSSSSIRLG